SAPPSGSATTCVRTSTASLERYQRRVAVAAPDDCRTIGVVHPDAPPSVRVTLGRYAREETDAVAAYASDVVALVGRTTAVTSCVAVMRSEYSPAPRHVAEAAWQGVV